MARRTAGAVPGWLKALAKRVLPRSGQAWLTSRLVDRFDPAALARFQREHRTRAPVERVWNGQAAVVMPCYNHAAYLEAALESLARQTYRPFEAVFVEDHSTDGTLERLNRLCPQLPEGIRPVVLRTPSNSGQAAALNLGIAAAQASVIMILNDDDYAMHDALEAALEVMRRNEDIYLLGAGAVPLAGSGMPASGGAEVLIRGRCPDYGAIRLARFGPDAAARFRHPNDLNMTHSGMSFFKAAWHAAGGYFPDRSRRVVAYSDRDFQMRVASLLPVAVAQDVPFVFWRTDSSVDHGRNS